MIQEISIIMRRLTVWFFIAALQTLLVFSRIGFKCIFLFLSDSRFLFLTITDEIKGCCDLS